MDASKSSVQSRNLAHLVAADRSGKRPDLAAINPNVANPKKSIDLLQLGISKLNPGPKETSLGGGDNNGGASRRFRDQLRARGRSRPAQLRFPRNSEVNNGGGWVTQGRTYASLMNSNPLEKKLKLMYMEPQKDENGSCFFEPNDEALNEAAEKWKDYLVGYFVADKPVYTVVDSIAKGFWTKLGLSEVLADNSGFFYFRIPDATNRRNILEGGPWMFQGKPIILQQWTPDMVMCKQSHDKIPLWVRIHRLPLALWTDKGLSGVASLVGRPLYADSYTEEMTRISFARVCVEVNASKPLPETVEVKLGGNAVCLKVDYQWKPVRCEKCCVFGHQCKEKLVGENVHQKDDAGKQVQKNITDPEGFTLVMRKKNTAAASVVDTNQNATAPMSVTNCPSDEDVNDENHDAIVNDTLLKDAQTDDEKSQDSSSSEKDIEEELCSKPVEAAVVPLKKNSMTTDPEAAAEMHPVVALPAAVFSEGQQQQSKGNKSARKKKGKITLSQSNFMQAEGLNVSKPKRK